ncbi:hypothetical protein BLX87_16130 [Bacillus sp. VT-16-64]|nr:hypothetical protein BLX87_16130 [Bacillus sp. VT-16-64]
MLITSRKKPMQQRRPSTAKNKKSLKKKVQGQFLKKKKPHLQDFFRLYIPEFSLNMSLYPSHHVWCTWSLSFVQLWIFPTWELNLGLLHYRQILFD